MKCNRQRLKEAADRRIGERYDYGITVGIKLAALACHRRFGFGRARLEILDREITALLGEITKGAAQQTEDYRYSVERGMEQLDEALQQIMGREEK